MIKLKIFVTTIIISVVLCSCGTNNEKKAQEMAANYLKGELYHFDSYEPIQTEVDSSFVSLSTDREAIELAMEMLKLFISVNEYSDEIRGAERSMEIYSPEGYYTSAYDRGEYRRAKEDRDKNERLLEKALNRIQNIFIKIKERQSRLKVGKFDGWMVYHKFKSLNGSGTLNLFGEYIFLCDKNFNERVAYQKEEFDMLVQVMDVISECSELPEFLDKVQDLALEY